MAEIMESRKVNADGIQFNGRCYNHAVLANYSGKVVEVKFVGSNLGVFLGGKQVCIATPVLSVLRSKR